jgi:hypothetical protein
VIAEPFATACKRNLRLLTDRASDGNDDSGMEQHKDVSDELYVLGFIAGLCNQQPRDVALLDDMLMYLREAQEKRERLIWQVPR